MLRGWRQQGLTDRPSPAPPTAPPPPPSAVPPRPRKTTSQAPTPPTPGPTSSSPPEKWKPAPALPSRPAVLVEPSGTCSAAAPPRHLAAHRPPPRRSPHHRHHGEAASYPPLPEPLPPTPPDPTSNAALANSPCLRKMAHVVGPSAPLPKPPPHPPAPPTPSHIIPPPPRGSGGRSGWKRDIPGESSVCRSRVSTSHASARRPTPGRRLRSQ